MEQKGFIKELLTKSEAADTDAIAVSVYDGNNLVDISYKQFASDILHTAGYFKENNIRNQHVALIAPNSYAWIVTFLGIIASGNVAVLMDPNLPKNMLHENCKKADVSVICAEDFLKSELLPVIEHTRWTDYRCFKAGNPLVIDEVYNHESNETIILMFTSGTTGQSKVVELTSDNLQTSAINLFFENNKRMEGGEIKNFMSLPLFHIGSVRVLIKSLLRHNTVCIGRGAKYVFLDMPLLNPTHVGMVPSMMESLAKIIKRTPLEERKKYVGSKLMAIYAVGASLKTAVAECLIDNQIRIEIIYGMTETTGDGSWCVLDKAHIGTIGKPDGHIAFCIRDGEILIKSDGVMKGYYKDPEETAKVIEDGWIHTGDMGYCDADGYYYIAGRKKNVIILSNGENVNPEEIEATFGNCEAIEECMVYSDGKGICADVFTKDRDAAAGYIKQYNENVPMYRQVYKVNYTEEPLPKTASGKIKRKENK